MLKNCKTVGTNTICNTLDPQATCGNSTYHGSSFNDGPGCGWGYVYKANKCKSDTTPPN